MFESVLRSPLNSSDKVYGSKLQLDDAWREANRLVNEGIEGRRFIKLEIEEVTTDYVLVVEDSVIRLGLIAFGMVQAIVVTDTEQATGVIAEIEQAIERREILVAVMQRLAEDLAEVQ